MLVEWHVIGTCCMQCDSSCMINSAICVVFVVHCMHLYKTFDCDILILYRYATHSEIIFECVNRTSIDWTYRYASIYSRLHAVNWYCETTAQQQPWFASLCTRSNVSTHAHYTLTRLFDYSYQTHNVHDILFSHCFVWIELSSTHWLPTLLSNRVALFISSRWDVSRYIVYANSNDRMIHNLSVVSTKR